MTDSAHRVLTLVSDQGNRRLLMDWLADKEGYNAVQTAESLETTDFDVAIIDRASLVEHRNELLSKKQAMAPMLIPYLLLIDESDSDIIEVDAGQLADNVVTETIDEIVTLPIKQIELEWRLEALLRLRQQSLTLHEQQSELRKTAHHLQATIDASPAAIIVVDTDGTVQEWNPAAERIFGWSKPEILGEPNPIIPPDKQAEFEAWVEEILEGRAFSGETTKRQTKAGELLDVRLSTAPVRDASDTITGAMAIIEDISDELERREKLQRFGRAIEASGHVIYITDTEGTIQYINPAFTDITGYTESEAIGKNPRILKSGEMQDSYYEELWDTVLAGEIWEETVINRRKNGELYHAQQTIAPVQTNGEIEGFVAIQTDISDQVERERQLQTLIGNLPGMVYRRRNEKGWPMELVRGDVRSLVGHSADELKSGSVSWGDDIIHPDDREHVWDTVQSSLDADKPFELTYRVRRRDDEVRWVWEQGQEIQLPSDDGSVLEGYITDITDQKELEADLQESLQRYESLFTGIRDAILVADTDRKIVNCNPAFTDLFGYELSEIEGRPTKLLYADDAEFEALGERLQHQGGELRDPVTLQYETKTGRVFSGETTVSALQDDDGELVGFIGLVRDITDRRERTRQIQVIDRVLRHNFHNDMNIIRGYAETIRDSATGDIAEQAATIVSEGNRLLQTVDKEREITELLADEPTLEAIDICNAVETAAADIKDRHSDASVSTNCQAPVVARAIPKIHQAITELLTNAIVHSDQSTPQVAVTVETTDTLVRIHVADDGPGIPEMEQEILTGEEDINPLYHGSGLGLWLVHLIVQESNGTLAFEANEPRGSVVTISLPSAETGDVDGVEAATAADGGANGR